ncbi:uncharacterized protein LOC127096259 [Lathyrus oleraceus]|uniref:uncharacterized protein LOC127096259 n=1 Tax=Pisum sativum TaxID=3888 RepID=UPI0021D07DB0|nr:uncharacterized protein LOC127096259 [Pisum sativum]
MTKKEELTVPQTLPPKLKDPGKVTISCNTGGVNIPHGLCDLGSSINVMPLNKAKELKVGKIIPSNMTLTLADSSVTHPPGILRDMLVHVDGLVFPANFMVIDAKGDSGGLIILGRSFLETGKVKINVETGKLTLKFNNKKMVFKVYEWTPYVEHLKTCYHLEVKGSKVDKGMKTDELTDMRVSLAPDVPYA